jgi:hypothetical protein
MKTDVSVYILADTRMRFMKVRIASDLLSRLKRLKRETPFGIQYLCHLFVGEGATAFKIEQELHSALKSCNFKGFEGATEWFTYDEAFTNMVALNFKIEKDMK